MILYNVTVKIDTTVHDEWKRWMKEVHMPDVLKTGFFTSGRMFRILTDDEPDGMTYSIQYTCASMDHFLEYESKFAGPLRAEHNNRYKDRFVAFRTLLEEA